LVEPPVTLALIVTIERPRAVLVDVLTFKMTETGFVLIGATTFDGWNEQLAPTGSPAHESVTRLLKAPAAETRKETGELVAPGTTLTVEGEGVLKLKSTMCKVREKLWMVLAGSVPTPCSLKK
jgi:hypothetical protein